MKMCCTFYKVHITESGLHLRVFIKTQQSTFAQTADMIQPQLKASMVSTFRFNKQSVQLCCIRKKETTSQATQEMQTITSQNRVETIFLKLSSLSNFLLDLEWEKQQFIQGLKCPHNVQNNSFRGYKLSLEFVAAVKCPTTLMLYDLRFNRAGWYEEIIICIYR